MLQFEHRFVAMGGPCRFRIEHAEEAQALRAIESAEAEVRRLEQKYSRYLADSITTTINEAAGSGQAVSIDAETGGLLHYADTLYRESEGLFDLTSGILRKAWDFKSGRLPSAAEIAGLLPLIGWQQVQWDATSVALPLAGMEIDFGGCVKEYACDSVAAVLRRLGIQHALVDLSGDMAAIGSRSDGQAWSIGIRHPSDRGSAIAQIPLRGGGLASSGDYQRCIEIEGKRYGHILNPQTGWPSHGLIAVSIAAEQCLVAGSTATIAMLKPMPEALEWLRALGISWLAVDARLQCHGTLQMKNRER